MPDFIDCGTEKQILEAHVAVSAHNQQIRLKILDQIRDSLTRGAKTDTVLYLEPFGTQVLLVLFQILAVTQHFHIPDILSHDHCTGGFYNMDQTIRRVLSSLS